MSRKVGNGLDLSGQRLSGLGAATSDTDALSRGVANGLYAGIGANARMLLASNGDVVPRVAGYGLTPRLGFPVGFAVTIYSLLIGLKLPVVGGSQVWTVTDVQASGTRVVIGTVTIADGNIGGVTNLGTPYALAATSALDIRLTSNGGTVANPGVGPSARVSFQNLTLALPTAPAAPTGLSVTAGTGINTVNYTLGATATDAIIWKNGQALTVSTGGVWVDTAGLGTDVYNVSAANLGSISAKSSNLTPTSSSFTYYASGVRNLSADTSDWIVTLGSAVTTPPAVDAAGKMTETSGATGSNSPNDKVTIQWKGPNGASGGLSALRRKELVSLSTAGSVWEYYFRSAAVSGTTSYIQIQFSTGQLRVGGKVGGSFLNWTLTGAANATCAQQTAGGTVPLTSSALGAAMNANGTTQYTIQCEVLPQSSADNSQTIKVYVDTAANYTSPALFVTVVINSTITAAFSPQAGIHWEDLLGNQSATATAMNLTKQNVVLTPLVTVGS